MGSEGQLLDRFASSPVDAGFWHTGRWQTWGPDSNTVYFQGGTLSDPRALRRDLLTGHMSQVTSDMEGAPPFGEPFLSSFHGMLYAAGYGDGVMHAEKSPMPFGERERHGLFEVDFVGHHKLVLSTAQVLASHPDCERLMAADAEQHARTGDGLTLMLYCVRWSPDGSRLLFYFGNHCVDKRRKEPRLAYVFTARADLSDLRLAANLSYDRRGVHWSWQPDNEKLIGYGPDYERPGSQCLAEVRADGSDYRRLSKHASGGHPSVSPADPNLVATDESGRVLLIDTRDDSVFAECHPPSERQSPPPPGRNPMRVCHHPVWDRDGSRLLINTLPGAEAVVAVVRF